jgi:prefoldin subunit 5
MEELVRQTTTITLPRQRRLNELSKQCQILDGLISADETNGKALLVTQDKIKSRENGIELLKKNGGQTYHRPALQTSSRP